MEIKKETEPAPDDTGNIVSLKDLRRIMLQKRDALSRSERQEKSGSILAGLFETEAYQTARNLLCYVSFRSEVQTEALLDRALSDGKQLYCPRVCGKAMEFYRVRAAAELQTGYKGIREPCPAEAGRFPGERALREQERTLMVVPGVLFDRQGGRIGYGGGYYDRYLSGCSCLLQAGILYTAALAYEMQIVDEILLQPHDIRVQRVITERDGRRYAIAGNSI